MDLTYTKRLDTPNSAINKYEMVINLRPQQRVNLTLAYEGHVDKIAGGGNSIKYELDVQVTPENVRILLYR